ncbi:hypothetical protein HOLleu_11265 [Holothuria leucospilota]|uniref:Uncharacterized protein n=1 Tax=Holothuria leucospilota TaxID=206669 RepID=A0A9Q1CFE1_HOLLE|nr:hypothetical protein HOLleu_11265 [Holothuria leucospilota]
MIMQCSVLRTTWTGYCLFTNSLTFFGMLGVEVIHNLLPFRGRSCAVQATDYVAFCFAESLEYIQCLLKRKKRKRELLQD